MTEDLKKAEKAYGAGSEKTKDYRKQLDEATEALDDMTAAADENRKKVGELEKGSGGLDSILSGVKDIAGEVGINIPGGLDDILGKMGGVSSSIGAVAGGVGTVAAALGGYVKIVDSTTQSFSDMKDSAQLLGLDTTAYQKLEYAIGKAGGSMDGLSEIINPLYSKSKRRMTLSANMRDILETSKTLRRTSGKL